MRGKNIGGYAITLALSVCFLSGCASRAQWTKPGFDPEEFKQDSYLCDREANILASQQAGAMSSSVNPIAVYALTKRTFFNNCMKGRGYQRFKTDEERRLVEKSGGTKSRQDYADSYYELGLSCQKSGQYKEAIKAFKKVLDLEPGDVEAYYAIGWNYLKLNQHTEAIEALNQVIRLDPKYCEAYILRGTSYFLKKQYNEAIEDFSIGITLTSNDTEGYLSRRLAYIARGYVYAIKGNYSNAIEDFSMAIAMNEKDVTASMAYAYRASAYEKMGQDEKAFEDINKAIAIKSDDDKNYMNRGFMSYKKGNYDIAIEDFNEAIHLNPNNVKAYGNRGFAYLDSGKYELAIADFQKSIELDKDNVDSYIGLSIAYFRQDKIEESKSCYKKATEIEPLCKDGLEALEREKGYLYTSSHKEAVKKILQPIRPITSTSVTPSSSATNIVSVTWTSANIRSGAGNEFPIVATVKQGDKLTVIGEYKEWFNVRLEDGKEGWINSRVVK